MRNKRTTVTMTAWVLSGSAMLVLCIAVSIENDGKLSTVLLGFALATVVLITAFALTLLFTMHLRVLRLERQVEELSIAAGSDWLTGLPNRRGFDPKANCALSTGEVTAVIMADLDHFKRWNTRLGHLGADELLKAVAQEIQHHTRDTDLICRWGGEEICIMLPDTSFPDAVAVAERIRHAISRIHFTITSATGEYHQISNCTISLGVAMNPEGNGSLGLIQELADQALQKAKDHGRNRVRSFDTRGQVAIPRQRGGEVAELPI
jgi:diguanylate cyclase (GGDEF)-like protein